MSGATKLLGAGQRTLRREFAIEFAVDGFTQSFTGRLPESIHRTTLDVDGFEPIGETLLCVQRAEFNDVGLTPREGMRISARGAFWTVVEVRTNAQTYNLQLMYASPWPVGAVAAP
jgi:hypothetical protein